jgi:SAM-dependent methyltransferase
VKAVTDFDCYADSYDRALGEALAASGEDRSYFARGRVTWLAGCLRRMGSNPRHVMDYGCGTGATTPLWFEILRAETVVGVDTSQRSLEVARRNHGSERVRFLAAQEYEPAGAEDLAYCNGVFHHIPPKQRRDAVHFVYRSLRPGGMFAFWENNPWNPGARYVMAHCAFDRDAVPLSPVEARRLLRSAGFTVLKTDFLFVFPRILRAFRPVERLIPRLPLGAQYQVLCQKLARNE